MTLWGKTKLVLGLCAVTILLAVSTALWRSNIAPHTRLGACALN
jgi:hypothetical protein